MEPPAGPPSTRRRGTAPSAAPPPVPASPPSAAPADQDPLAAQLAAIVGAEHVLVDPALCAGYEIDWTRRFRGRARLVVRPRTTEEVARVVRTCAVAGVPIVPQGGNTGLVGGGVPHRGEVLLSLRRLDDLGEVDAAALQVTAAAGVTLAELQTRAREAGLEFGVDLAARDSATVGGMIATNAGGVHVLRHGTMRAQVVGIEAVLASGEVVSRMPGLLKDNAGYAVPELLAGSEGTLAVITRARLRLIRSPRHRVVALVALASDVPAAGPAATGREEGTRTALTRGAATGPEPGTKTAVTTAVKTGAATGPEPGTKSTVTTAAKTGGETATGGRSGALGTPEARAAASAVALTGRARARLDSLQAAELFFEAGLALVLRQRGGERPFRDRQAGYLLIECAADSDPSSDLATLLSDAPEVVDAVLASDASGRQRLWSLREAHTEAIGAAGIAHKLDVSVPLARLPELVDGLPRAIARAVDGGTADVTEALQGDEMAGERRTPGPPAPVGLELILFGHVGDGNLHVNVLGLAPDDDRLDEAVLRLVAELGGSISAEHGVGVAKRRWLGLTRSAADIAAMRAIKRALDPAGLLNPEVLFPPVQPAESGG